MLVLYSDVMAYVDARSLASTLAQALLTVSAGYPSLPLPVVCCSNFLCASLIAISAFSRKSGGSSAPPPLSAVPWSYKKWQLTQHTVLRDAVLTRIHPFPQLLSFPARLDQPVRLVHFAEELQPTELNEGVGKLRSLPCFLAVGCEPMIAHYAPSEVGCRNSRRGGGSRGSAKAN